MPGFDGFQLAAWIKNDAHLSRTVIAMLTSGDHPEDMSRCEQLGIAAYLLKPAKQSEILTAIERALGIAATGEMLLGAVSGRPQTLRRLRILLVEDSLVNQKLAVALLEEQGHAVTVAGNGRDALAAIESERFDLVLMDLQMPEMDGLEATSRIRQREQQTGSHLPIVAMTAHALAEDRQRCLEAGMDGYIAKPIRSGQLSEAIGALFATPALPTVPEAAEMAGGEDVDWSKALAAVHNNHRSLRKVVEAALQEFPRLLAAMRKAVDDRDAMSLRLSAHTLKGALRVFGQGPGLCETCRLEEMGLRNELADAGGPLAALEMRIAGLAQDLQDYLQRGDTLQR
jgi:CheY-like chemotaxis protein